MVQKIRVRVKGRLVIPKVAESLVYEIRDYNEQTAQVALRLLFDPNGILLSKNNSYSKATKNVRATMIEKHYKILPQDEEYDLRQQMLSNPRNKFIVKYQVIDCEGEPLCLTN